MSKMIPVSYEGKPCYEIHLEQDFSKLLNEIIKLGYGKERKVCVITDSNVAPLYLGEITTILKSYFSLCISFIFDAGESSKNTDTVGSAYEQLILNGFDRKDLLVALGGGVVGDLTGFTAATFLRGIDFIQIPTTLLSQVDSSIGGKTGVDFMQYKNMVGAFYMPKLVYMNLSTLQTLPPEQYFAGMGEILKHGQIKSAEYFNLVKSNMHDIIKRQFEAVETMVYGSCLIKRQVVQDDPKEQGERALLNFGHTIGHAIEKLSDFKLLHGECVALGMVGAAYISCYYGNYKKEQLQELEQILKEFYLPIRLEEPSFSAKDVLNATKLDKKMESGKIKFVLVRQPGEAYLTKELNDEQVLAGIQYLF